MKHKAAIFVVLFSLSGCAWSEANLRRRAAFDFQCQEQSLLITRLSGANRGVEGCGHRGTYVFVDGTGWVLNSNTQ